MDPAQEFEQAMIARRRAMVDNVPGSSEIQEYYKDATIFVTGASGFLGKQLVEKLLRDCNVKRIYLLLRPKKVMKAEDRLKEILEDPVFSRLREQKPSFMSKMICLQGEVGETRLGLTDQVWETLADEVEMIFHVAATTKFDECLRTATLVNVRGTREALQLGRECTKMRSFVYVSTAYSHATSDKIKKTVHEKFYESPIEPEKLIQMAENLTENALEEKAPNMTSRWPNTYTYTKAVAEEQVRLLTNTLPICVVRPAVVISALYEPSPGWMDFSSIRSASGIIFGGGMGILHTVQLTPSAHVSLVPVDFVNNATIAAGFAASRRDGAKIYSVVMSQDNRVCTGDALEHLYKVCNEIPFPESLYLVKMFAVQSRLMFVLLSLFLHFIPGAVADLILTFFGKKRRFIHLYKRIFKLTASLNYFLSTIYCFDGTNTKKLFENLNETDQAIFLFDMKSIDWYEFCKTWCIGIRKYILKDELKNTDLGKRKQFWFKYLNYVVMFVYLYGIWIFISGAFNIFVFALMLVFRM